jgi:hypothetical protein
MAMTLTMAGSHLVNQSKEKLCAGINGDRTNNMQVRWFSKTVRRCEYASTEEFASAFECERAGLQKLALFLTSNRDAANQCLILAFRECIASGSVSKGWMISWTRRVVIRTAINLVMSPRSQSFVGTDRYADCGVIAFSPDVPLGAIAEPESILDLSEFERFVLVICVVEHYSIHDCALLLGRSPRDIDEARQRVGNHVRQIDELSNRSQHFAIS